MRVKEREKEWQEEMRFKLCVVLHKPLTIHRGKKNIITSAENINSLEA